VIAIGGLALFIAAVAMTVSGLTFPSRYAGATPPPNVGQLGVGQVIGGIALLVLGMLLIASAAALLSGLPRSRPFAVGSAGLTALLTAAAIVLLFGAQRRDLVLLAALVVALVAFGGAALILARLRR
jgi:hypothetical protein